jgi:hypothetical protein
MKKILVVSCTARREQDKKDLKIYQSLEYMTDEVKQKIHFENKKGLPEIYNQYINHNTLKKHDIVLFVHDDVYIDDYKLRGKLYAATNAYDIIGLAGALQPAIKSPALWHLMAPRENWRGYVAHSIADSPGTVHMTSFGPTPSRVAIADGVFLAVNLKRAIGTDWKFNEDYRYHHYDIASCLDANKKKLKIGVSNINVIHDSPGLENINDPEWLASEKKFLQSYS